MPETATQPETAPTLSAPTALPHEIPITYVNRQASDIKVCAVIVFDLSTETERHLVVTDVHRVGNRIIFNGHCYWIRGTSMNNGHRRTVTFEVDAMVAVID